MRSLHKMCFISFLNILVDHFCWRKIIHETNEQAC